VSPRRSSKRGPEPRPATTGSTNHWFHKDCTGGDTQNTGGNNPARRCWECCVRPFGLCRGLVPVRVLFPALRGGGVAIRTCGGTATRRLTTKYRSTSLLVRSSYTGPRRARAVEPPHISVHVADRILDNKRRRKRFKNSSNIGGIHIGEGLRGFVHLRLLELAWYHFVYIVKREVVSRYCKDTTPDQATPQTEGGSQRGRKEESERRRWCVFKYGLY
jgi:hypothetical protein